MESRATRRLQKEYEDITRNYSEIFRVELGDEGTNWNLWLVSFTGAEGTVFAGERYTLEFKFSDNYPIEAPDVIFKGAYPHHEHVYSNGYICLSILYDDWTPSLRVSSVALSVLSMLSSAPRKMRPPNDASFVQYANGRSPKSFRSSGTIMSTAVFVQDADLYSALSLQTILPGPVTLSRGAFRLSAPGRDICLLAAPADLKGQISMAAIADILVCKAPWEDTMESSVKAKREFVEMLVRNYVMGLKYVVVCVNDPSPDDLLLTHEHFTEISTELNQQFRRVGYASRAYIVPTSVPRFVNIRDRSKDFEWYSGPSLLETIGNIDLPPKPVGEFVFTVRDTFQRAGTVVCCGRVLRGVVSVGDTVIANPGMKVGRVSSLGYFGEMVTAATSGDLCGVGLLGITRKDLRRGVVLSSLAEPCCEVTSFEAQLISLSKELHWGWEPTMYVHCTLVPVRVDQILKQVDKRTGVAVAEWPEKVKPGEACLAKITPKKPISLRIFTQLPQLGRLILSSSNKCEMVGVVRGVTDIRSSKW